MRRDSKRRNLRKKGDEVIYGRIFCDKDDALTNGAYVFRINGALSRMHTHSETKWEFCGLRGTSAEELQFTMKNGVCIPHSMRSRWDMTNTPSYAKYIATVTLRFDDLSTLQALSNVSYNEMFMDELDSALLLSMLAIGNSAMVVSVSVNSVEMKESVFKANIGLRVDTFYVVSGAQKSLNNNKQGVTMLLQERLSSGAYFGALMSELHKYPEFAAVSSIAITDVTYDRSFEIPSHVAPYYSTKAMEHKRTLSSFAISAPYVVIAFAGLASLVVGVMRLP
jgi:hypothetical protein